MEILKAEEDLCDVIGVPPIIFVDKKAAKSSNCLGVYINNNSFHMLKVLTHKIPTMTLQPEATRGASR